MLEKEYCKNLIYILDVPERNAFTNYALQMMEIRRMMEIQVKEPKYERVLTVRPSDHVASPQVFRSQPIFEGPEVFSEGSRVQSVLTDGFLKRLLPRHRGAPLHDFSANNNRAKIALFHGIERGKINRKENATYLPSRNRSSLFVRCCSSTEIISAQKKKKKKYIMAHDWKNRGRGKSGVELWDERKIMNV